MKQKTSVKKPVKKASAKSKAKAKEAGPKKYTYEKQVHLYMDKKDLADLKALEQFHGRTGSSAIKFAIRQYPKLMQERSQLETELRSTKYKLSLISDKMASFKSFLEFISDPDKKPQQRRFGTNSEDLFSEPDENRCAICGGLLDEDDECPEGCNQD